MSSDASQYCGGRGRMKRWLPLCPWHRYSFSRIRVSEESRGASKRLGIGLQMVLGSQREVEASLNIFMISVLNSFSGVVCLWNPLLEN